MKPWGSIKQIIKQPLSEKPRNIFQKHKYLYRAMMHLHLKSYGDQYYWSYRLTRNCKGLSRQLFCKSNKSILCPITTSSILNPISYGKGGWGRGIWTPTSFYIYFSILPTAFKFYDFIFLILTLTFFKDLRPLD